MRLRAASCLLAATALAFVGAEGASSVARADAPAASIWVVEGDVPLADGVQSVEILRDDEALSVTPGGSRRGLVALGTRLPILGVVGGIGCVSRWILVGPLSYVCSDRIAFSTLPPSVPGTFLSNPTDGLPYHYYFAGKEGADVFSNTEEIDDESPSETLSKGWAIASVSALAHHGAQYVVTRKGRLVPRAQIGAVNAFGFHGVELDRQDGDAPGVGFVLVESAPVLSDAKAGSKSIGTRTRLQKVDVLETKKVGNALFHRIGEGEWLRGQDVRVPTVAPPPDALGAHERWIDVDTTTQTLVAYEGTRPVFATVVSTGRPWSPTPKGTFKIWVKLRSNTMSNADSTSEVVDEDSLYSIEDVPWVQYFTTDGVALHGAFWHRSFGYPHSHGCVNIAPLDAMRLFGWTLPRVPAGWDASFPTTAEPATTVRVR